MGMDGYFTDMGYDGNAGDGYVPTPQQDQEPMALKARRLNVSSNSERLGL